MDLVPRIVLVIPCYNEADRLDEQAFRLGLSRIPTLQLLFVDDGSTDRTSHVIEQLIARCPNRVDLLRLPRNVGKAEAVRLGLLRALAGNPEFVGYWDADLATPLDEIPPMLDLLRRSGRWLVTGARIQLLGHDIRRSALRHYLGRVFATAAALTLGVPVYDTQCGAKIFVGRAVPPELLETPFVTRWIFDVEILARLKHHLRSRSAPPHTLSEAVTEHPLFRWVDTPGSKVRATDFLRAGVGLLRIRALSR